MKVFISHAESDRELADRVARGLKKAGLEVWEDDNILPGDNWAEMISQRLQNSHAMIVLLTRNALDSPWVQHEISYALGEKRFSRRLIPVLVGDPETFPRDDIPWILRRLDVVEWTPRQDDDEESVEKIARVLLKAS